MSYHYGGATISTYRDGNGKEGLYNRRFAVYNQKTDPFGNKVIKEKTLDNRTTHWVPEHQT
jgi:formamidopyrimidine-DNA glycosylase